MEKLCGHTVIIEKEFSIGGPSNEKTKYVDLENLISFFETKFISKKYLRRNVEALVILKVVNNVL